MKRFFIWITAVVMALSCVTVAFAAGYSKLDNLTPGQVGYVLGQLLTEKTGNYVYDVPWYADSYDYRVIVSYDSLSELCSTANGLGMTCSVRWNHNAKLYVISVDDYTTFELSSTHGVIGNPDGYIYAAYDESEQGIWNNYGIGQWGVYADYSSTSVFREVSYATLSELCANLNEKGIPCYIASTSAWGSSTYWYIRGSGTVVYQQRYDSPSISYSITNHVYLDIAAAPLVARYNPESTLSSCLSRLTSIQTNVTTIKNNIVNTISSNLESLLTTCNTISTKLDTLTSVISNGKVLVDNSDVVSAIQSIPAFDDTELLDRVGTIVEQIDTLSRKIDLNYFPNMYGKVTSIADTLGNTNKHLITGNRHTSEIIDMLTAAVDVDTGKLLVADTGMISAVTTISNQITEQFGEYDSTYSFPNFSSSGQSAANNKTVSGVLPSAFTSINPGTRQLLYSPSGTLILPKRVLYNGGGDCKNVYCTPYIHQTYGLGYRLEFLFRFSHIQNTPRTETVQFPQVSFTDYSGETLTLSGHSGTVRVSPRRDVVSSYLYYFPRWDASDNWLGWSGQNDTFQFSSSSYEPSKRVYLTPPESGTYYIYGTSDTAIPVVYASRFTGFLQSQTDRVVNAVGSIPAPTDYTSQLTAVTGRMDDILAQLQSTSGSATCEHTYSQHMEQEATCILPGLMISTCSKCGDSSSEIVDPLGHDWQCTSHVDAVTDPDTGEETSSAYDIYTCSRCGDTYEDHTGTGAPDEDYSNTTISQLVVKVFSKLGTFAGKLLGSVVRLFDKAVNAVDDLASKFNDYVEQIKGFGENYPIWLSGFWGIIPAELQVALTFAVICMALGVVGKKLFFS